MVYSLEKAEKSMFASRGIIMAPLLSTIIKKRYCAAIKLQRVVNMDTLKMSTRRIWGSRQYQRSTCYARLPANCSQCQVKQQPPKWPAIASVAGIISNTDCFHWRCLLLLVWVVWVELKQKLLWLQAALEWWQRYEICIKMFQSANVILICQWFSFSSFCYIIYFASLCHTGWNNLWSI